jgi:putative protease
VDDSFPIPELLMPAGGFDSAVASIEGGADALYLGFSEFSARRQARNFDRLEYRRLYRFARQRGVKIYITLNTVVFDDELEGVASLLAFLGRFPPDAALVQDWGLAALIRKSFPGIAIHASTQAAAQGASAARIAAELGATRVVLPRETSLAEMARIHAEEPGIELEAFVHGALCYSFSGLCLASGLVLGRSGNRGECAQLCRSYYDVADSVQTERSREKRPTTGKEGRGFWFSCRDLELADRVKDLAGAGIRSLKVEGRMKGPEYCYAVARLYRGVIDRMRGEGPSDEEIDARRLAARTAFARSPTDGWLFERGGASLIDPSYPGHRGVPAGRVLAANGARLVVDLSTDLNLRDGLLAFESGDQFKPCRFSALGLRDAQSGREAFAAKAGDKVELEAPVSEGRRIQLEAGAELFRISARDMDRRAPSREEFEPSREELRLKLRFDRKSLGAEFELPRFDGRKTAGESAFSAIEPGEELKLDRSKREGSFARALAVFSECGEADFRLVPEIDPSCEVALGEGPEGPLPACAMGDLFIPPSVLKREKNRVYERASGTLAEAELSYARESVSRMRESLGSAIEGRSSATGLEAPPRAALVFPRDELPAGMPFAARRDIESGSALPSWGGRLWLPLAPLVADRDEYAKLVRERVENELAAGGELSIGIGALHHIALARELLELRSAPFAGRGDEGHELRFFLDIGFYVANSLAFASLSSLLPRVDFAYRYIEEATIAREGERSEAPLAASSTASARIAPIGPGFEPPLFQSLGCALKHHVNRGACPPDCGRSWSLALRDRDRRYRLHVEDCVTMLFRDGGAPDS